MKIERTRNAGRNILFGTILKIYQMIIPFLMRTIMIYFMGVEYLGLNSLFTSILQVLNLAELGVGSAMVYSMYKPIAEDDKSAICALMKLYRTYYRVIGTVILAAGMCLLPFIPKLIKSDVPPDINIYVLYLLNLAVTVLSYWLFAYKNCLLDAHQRTDVTSKVTLITNTLQYGIQILVLIFLKNYYIYVIVMLATQALTNISIACVVTKIYPEYAPNGKMSSEEVRIINHRIRDLFTSKIGTVIVNSADTLVISAFLGLRMLAIYQNYFYILTAIIGIVGIVFGSCTAGIGNSIIVETKEKNFNDLKKFTFILMWISGFCATCLLCMYQPFMEIWVGKKLQLNFSAVICFCIYYFVYEFNQLLLTYKDASGMWHEDRFRPLVTALVNLGLNLIMVQVWGIYGVLLSTVLSTVFVGMPWLFYNLFTVVFEIKYLGAYLKLAVKYILTVLFGAVITFFICDVLVSESGVVQLIERMIVCCLIPNCLYLFVYYRTKEFQVSLELVDRMTKGKIHKILSALKIRGEYVMETKQDCCGCNACVLACPRKCIVMQTDEEGFWYPRINKTECISCGKCKKVCPVINQKDTSERLCEAYAVYAQNEKLREESSSGGVFSLLAGQILNQKGIVYGAAFDEKWQVHHIAIDNFEDLKKLRGSKYLQSDIGNTYSEVKDNLDAGKQVLFSGTPCQIAGLLQYLGKQYVNLFTVDILCHGVPSPKVWKKYVDHQMKNSHDQIQNVNFRSKRVGWRRFSLEFQFKNGQIVSETLEDDLFMKLFLNNICLRPSCHNCRFKELNRSSDITIGDFWGIENVASDMDDDKGTSLVIVHSNQGAEALHRIASKIQIEKVDVEKALPVSADSRHSVSAHRNRNQFFKKLDECSINDLERMLNVPIYYIVLRKGKSVIKALIAKCK